MITNFTSLLLLFFHSFPPPNYVLMHQNWQYPSSFIFLNCLMWNYFGTSLFEIFYTYTCVHIHEHKGEDGSKWSDCPNTLSECQKEPSICALWYSHWRKRFLVEVSIVPFVIFTVWAWSPFQLHFNWIRLVIAKFNKELWKNRMFWYSISPLCFEI